MRIRILVALHEEGSKDGRNQSKPGDHKRIDRSLDLVVDDPKCQSRDQGSYIRLEQVRTHTGNITYVIAYIVRDNSRNTRVILRDPCFYLTYKIRTHIRCLRIDTAAYTGKQRDRRCAEAESGKNIYIPGDQIDRAHTEYTKSGNAHSHNCPA